MSWELQNALIYAKLYGQLPIIRAFNMKDSPAISSVQSIPATDISLTGQHLIEASAGTGKTWTLTGIVLRLLIEAKRPPEQIICTTFTRAASAEMRERIMARLNEFFYLLQWLEKISGDSNNHPWLYLADSADLLEDENEEKTKAKKEEERKQREIFRNNREEKLLNFARHTSQDISETIQDPVNLHLINYLLDSFATYSLSMAIRRTQLLLISMDKLFVGTLDSLAQKWLTEYSVETGYQKGMKISDNDEDKVADIVHDEIRKFHSRTHANNPILYKLLQKSGKLTAVDDHIHSVNKAMQFISAPIDELQGFDFGSYQALIKKISEQGIEDIRPYFDENHRKKQGIRGGTNLFKLLPSIAEIFTCIQQYQAMYCLHLETSHQKFLDTLCDVVIDPKDTGFGFNKNREMERKIFINLPTVQALFQLNQLVNALDDENHVLNRQIALAVRHRLPLQLEENNQTTFSLQMVRLNQALSGKQGQKLARYIRHHYPVALIDESQDINGEQASMIGAIYMPKKAMQDKANSNTDGNQDNNQDNNKSTDKKDKPTFLLLVGDPKQAIYGFRGGDVANYTAMKAQFDKKNQMTLTVNRRSNAKVIDSLNQWFSADKDYLKELGEGIDYHQIEAFKETSALSWHSDGRQETSILGKQAVSVIRACYAKKGDEHNVAGSNEYEGLAQHIHYLLNSNETIEGKPITPQDIAILARGRKGLKQANWALEKLGIDTVKTAETSVFSSQMATDLLAVLQAIRHPFRTDFINRALTTAWYGLTLQQVKLLEKTTDSVSDGSINATDSISNISDSTGDNNVSYNDFQIHLQKSEQLWSDYGVLSALQFLLGDCLFAHTQGIKSKNSQSKTKKVSVWEQLANGLDCERNLLDLRQLLELLTSNTRGMTATEVTSWLAFQRHKMPNDEDNKQHPIPTESGVQMMTIHKSKGLEFPIVYILGMDSSAKQKVTGLAFFPYIQNSQRRLSPIKQDSQGIDYQALVNIDNLGEAKRIAYVALTRASEQVYVVVRDHYNKTDLDYCPANIWLESEDKTYTLPTRLANHVDWIECADIVENVVETIIENVDSQKKTNNDGNIVNMQKTIQNIDKPEPIIYPNYDEVIKQKYFIGWRKTSFTALSRQLDKHSEDVAVSEPDYLFEDGQFEDGQNGQSNRVLASSPSEDIGISPFSEDNIRFTFVRGAGAGTFLHQVFELMDFNNPENWSEQIDKGLREYGLPNTYQSTFENIKSDSLATATLKTDQSTTPLDSTQINEMDDSINTPHNQLKSWLTDVLHSPLNASGKKLIDIPMQARKAEMGFDMGLGDGFRVERINDVLIKHLGEDSDKLLTLTASDSNHYYRYLRGEIDLVYTDSFDNEQGKYYVVDYKSNHLGNDISDYSQAGLSKAMSKAGYWLQALIYQVALHRFLRLRLADYLGNETRYLGAVEYLFIRGCVAQQDGADYNQQYATYGKITWDIPFALIEDMDRVFASQ